MSPSADVSLVTPLPGHAGALVINVDGLEAIAQFPNSYEAAKLPIFAKALQESLLLGLQTIITKMPEDRGGALKSLKLEMSGPLSGQFGSELEYVKVLEFGRKPGSFPPVAPLEAWAQRHGMPGAGYPIARRIFAVGMEGHHMFEETADEIRPEVGSKFNIAVQQAIAAGLITARTKAATTRDPHIGTGASAISILRRRGLLPGE